MYHNTTLKTIYLNAYGSPVHTTEAAVNALPVLPAPIHTRTQVMFKVKLFVAFILVVFGSEAMTHNYINQLLFPYNTTKV